MLSALGDAVMTLPVVNALRRSFPDVHLTWVLQAGPHALLRGHPAVNDFVVLHRSRKGLDARALKEGAEGLWDALRLLRASARHHPEGRFDLLVDLQVYLKAGLLTALTPAAVKLGFDRRRARDLNWLFTTHRIPPRPDRFAHVQEQYFEFLRHLGVEPEPVEYGLSLSEAERAAQSEFFRGLDRPACAVVLATSDPRKNWSAEGYARVLRELSVGHRLQPLLVGGRSPAEEAMAWAVRERMGPGASVVDARADDLRRLLWLLDGSALVVSPDTGPLHMARAVGVPVVGMFGFTNPRRSGPYRRFEDLVVDGYARAREESYPVSMERREGGMGRITPEMVLEKVGLALRRYPGPPARGQG
jgi:heptosyltransferase I